MNNKIEITFDLFNRFTSMCGDDTHIDFVTKLLDRYSETPKQKELIIEPNTCVKKKTKQEKKNEEEN